ncbi:MAG: hypothetical protein HY235_09685 [Acidobacteria bacterium]|nr:hypothetical protein [Acidobacteriota bacterium]
MHRSEFGDWGKELSDGEFWRAAAMLGVFCTVRLDEIPSNDDVRNRWADWLGPSIGPSGEGQESSLPWLLDAELVKGSPRVADAGVLEALWQQLQRDGKLPPRLWSFALYENQEELGEWMSRHASVSLFFGLPASPPGADWQWPVRFGFMDGERSQKLQEEVTRVQQASRVLPNLMRVGSVAQSSVFEFLVLLRGLEDAVECLDDCPVPVRAHCVLLLDPDTTRVGQFTMPQLAEIQRRTLAKGVVLAGITEKDRAGWLAGLVYELSHNLALDQVLVRGRMPPPLLFLDPQLLNISKIGRYAERLGVRLERIASAPVLLGDEEARVMGMAAGEYPAWRVGGRLREIIRQPWAFDRESMGASWTMNVQRAASLAQALRRRESTGEMETPWGESEARRLQLNVSSRGEPARFFEARRTYDLELWIGSRQQGAFTGAVFPEELLPQEEEGHLLTVSFHAPDFMESPQVNCVFLPRLGDSTHCVFEVSTQPAEPYFEGRFVIAYQNRVLQTYLLRGSVKGAEDAGDEAIHLDPEMATQAGWSGLPGQRAYGPSIILNRLAGKRRLYLQGAYNQLSFALPDKDAAVTEIESRIDSSKWDSADFKNLEAKGSQQLLYVLCAHGSTFLEAVKGFAKKDEQSQKLLKRLLEAGTIQVLSANQDTRLPVEFFYSLPFPGDDAKLCPNHRQALTQGSCGDCPNQKATHFCPMGLWCLSKIIEWHDFEESKERLTEFAPREYAIESRAENDTAIVRDQLRKVGSAVVGASVQVDGFERGAVKTFLKRVQALVPATLVEDWDAWKSEIRKSPEVLLLLPHTEKNRIGLEAMEISGKTIPSGRIDETYVVPAKEKPGPIVLLIGCNTDNLGVAFRNLSVRFASKGAAVVVSTISHVLGRHAAPLAAEMVEQIVAAQKKGNVRFGELMRDFRRHWLLKNMPPIALVLKAYGDARWRL